MSTNDGGPAFPVREAERFNPENGETHAIEQHWGMTIRDWFAGQAMAGIIARKNPNGVFGGDVLDTEDINPGGTPVNTEGDRSSYDLFLRWGPTTAYAIADAMLAARNGNGGAA